MLQTKVVEKIKTNIFSQQIFSENFTIYETMQKNTVEPGGPGTATWCMPTAGQIPKATNTPRIHKSTPFHCKNGCINAPQCYVIHKMLVLLLITW